MGEVRCILFSTAGPQSASLLEETLRTCECDAQAVSTQVLVRAATSAEASSTRRQAIDCIRRSGLEGAIVSVRLWDAESAAYVESWATDEPWLYSALDAADVRWAVSARPATIFKYRKVRSALSEVRRPLLTADGHSFEIGVSDEREAELLSAMLKTLPDVAEVAVRPMGRIERWRIRQRLGGNYAVDADPSAEGAPLGQQHSVT